MKTFIISRTDAIGDVVLTLPVAGRLKQLFSGCRIVLLGRTYTQAVADSCPWVDDFLNYDELLALPITQQVAAVKAIKASAIIHVFPNKQLAILAYRAGIPIRIGTRNRWFHWLTCNRLVALSRKNSPLHEAQLNMALLGPLGQTSTSALPEIVPLVKLHPVVSIPEQYQRVLVSRQPGQLTIILHPRSRGSAREWGLPHFGTLARLLHQAGHRVIVTGTAAEGEELRDWLAAHQPYLTADLTGQLSLPQLLACISNVDGLVAGSTGPLHLAAALGRHTVGLYPPIRPMHPGRWAPLGVNAEYFVFNRPDCEQCRTQPASCSCIKLLEPVSVLAQIQSWRPLPLVGAV